MRALNKREKILGCLIVAMLAIGVGMQAKKSFQGDMARLKGQLTSLRQEKERIVGEQAAAIANRTDFSQNLLNEISAAITANVVRVVRINHTSETSFRVEIQADFVDVMKVVGYLEREAGKFTVEKAELVAAPFQGSGLVNGVLSLQKKGAT